MDQVVRLQLLSMRVYPSLGTVIHVLMLGSDHLTSRVGLEVLLLQFEQHFCGGTRVGWARALE